MGKKRKPYKKPLVEKVNLRVGESVLQVCKTDIKIVQPTKSPGGCAQGPPPKCEETVGS